MVGVIAEAYVWMLHDILKRPRWILGTEVWELGLDSEHKSAKSR